MTPDDDRLRKIERRLRTLGVIVITAAASWSIDKVQETLQRTWGLGDPLDWIIAMAIIVPIGMYLWRDFAD